VPLSGDPRHRHYSLLAPRATARRAAWTHSRLSTQNPTGHSYIIQAPRMCACRSRALRWAGRPHCWLLVRCPAWHAPPCVSPQPRVRLVMWPPTRPVAAVQVLRDVVIIAEPPTQYTSLVSIRCSARPVRGYLYDHFRLGVQQGTRPARAARRIARHPPLIFQSQNSFFVVLTDHSGSAPS
jgi:hypothetical protein